MESDNESSHDGPARRLSFSASRTATTALTKNDYSVALSNDPVSGTLSNWKEIESEADRVRDSQSATDIFAKLRKFRDQDEWHPSPPADETESAVDENLAEGIEDTGDQSELIPVPLIRFTGKQPQSIVHSAAVSSRRTGTKVTFESVAADDIRTIRGTFPSEIQSTLPEEDPKLKSELEIALNRATKLLGADFSVDKLTREDLGSWLAFGEEVLKRPTPTDTLQQTLRGVTKYCNTFRTLAFRESEVRLMTEGELSTFMDRVDRLLGSKHITNDTRERLKSFTAKIRGHDMTADDPLLPVLQKSWKRMIDDATTEIKNKERDEEIQRESARRVAEARRPKSDWRQDMNFSSSRPGSRR